MLTVHAGEGHAGGLADFISALAEWADGSTAYIKFQGSILVGSERIPRSVEQREIHFETFGCYRQTQFIQNRSWCFLLIHDQVKWKAPPPSMYVSMFYHLWAAHTFINTLTRKRVDGKMTKWTPAIRHSNPLFNLLLPTHTLQQQQHHTANPTSPTVPERLLDMMCTQKF